MLKELYEQIRKDAHNDSGLIMSPEDLVYATGDLYLPPIEPHPLVLPVHSLAGLVDFIRYGSWTEDRKGFFVHVCSPSLVKLVGPLYGRNNSQRNEYCAAAAIINNTIRYGQYLDQETMVIGALTNFEETTERNALLKLIGNLKDEAVTTMVDDGVTQQVTAFTGVARAEHVEVKNPITLQPFRTFAGIEQPPSLFILRIQHADKGGPKIALFQVEDNLWQHDAMAAIKKFLLDTLDTLNIKLPVIG